MIVAIDDMQWSDSDSLALLSALMRPPAAPQLLLVTARRPGGVLPEIPRLGSVVLLPLGPLVLEESTELLGRLLSSAPEVDKSRERILALAAGGQGHPLFLREMVRQLDTPSARPGEPIRLDEALWRRISALEPDARALLELTAVAGGPVTQRTVSSTPRT
jgi:eukaryotic-like serine/threonine-protein kinase